MSDGSSRDGYLGPTEVTDIQSVFDRYSFNPILFRESRHIMFQLNGDRLYCIDTSLS